ncbi:MAG TPA: hypothetical protein VML53_05660 [Thermoplasmata archaeon]|nr:hypothetical protein [Thermoplasmata archaeon]
MPRPRAVTTRWLVRFGYDGSSFAGWARQPARRTVEGEILAGLRRAGLEGDGSATRVEVASRTDRGVSARANALLIDSPLPGAALLRLLNGLSPEIFFAAASPVSEAFRLRSPTRRVYRYFEPWNGEHEDRWRSAARLFRGPVDVRTFGRGFSGSRPTFRELESVSIRSIPGGLEIDAIARSFVWGMVRKIVSALREHAEGRVSLSRLELAIAGKERLSLPLANPERLVLWDVEYPISWQHHRAGPSRRQASWQRGAIDGQWARAAILRSLIESTA